MHEPKYSGPGKTGICRCGHKWEDHHLCAVMNRIYWEQTKESYIVQECEFYGCNEVGGMMQNEDGEWVDHCHGYVDSRVDES